MKWPARGLEARLKASLRKLFKTRLLQRRKSRSTLTALPNTRSCDDHCTQCTSLMLNNQWGDSVVSPAGSVGDQDSSTRAPDNEQAILYVLCTNTPGHRLTGPQIIRRPMRKERSRSDASVNTESNLAYNHQDAFSQAEFGDLHVHGSSCDYNTDVKLSNSRPAMISVATDPMDFENLESSRSIPETQTFQNETKSLRAPSVESYKRHISPASYHSYDPILNDRLKTYQRRAKVQEKVIFFDGDAQRYPKKTMKSSTVSLDHAARNSYPEINWYYDSCIPQSRNIGEANAGLHFNGQIIGAREGRGSPVKSPTTSLPRSSWFLSSNFLQREFVPCRETKYQTHRSEFRRTISDLCTDSKVNWASQSTKGNKLTKECGDEFLMSNIKAPESASISLKLKNSVTNLDCPVPCTVAAVQEPVTSLGVANFQADRLYTRNSSDLVLSCVPARGQSVASQFLFDNTDSLSESVGDHQQIGGHIHRHSKSGKRPGLAKNRITIQKDSRPVSVHLPVRRASVELQSRQSEMSCEHCISEKDTDFRPTESSSPMQKRPVNVNAKPDEVYQPEKPADITSPSSPKIKSTLSEHKLNTSKKSPPKSPTPAKRTSRIGGALPASRDLHQCPTGRHPEVNPEKPCICIMVKRMVLAQSKPVLYTWHYKAGKNLSSQRSLHADAQAEGETKSHTPVASAPRSVVPSLPNFQLARPTRMVRGGQGTVAWVTNATTGHFYALKFKQRDSRSESTWEIERREAKLLRYARHEFIVKLYHIYETDDTLFMALEWLDGGCLWNHIARLGTIPECYALYYASCILTALRYLHSRCIVYRDMKAENVVLDQRGRPKLIDFGMAKRFRRRDLSKDSHESIVDDSVNDSEDYDQPPTRYYFAAYLAPEIYDNDETPGQLIDSWGLGYILVEMLLGYGIFLPMPWEKEPGQHLTNHWQLNLPSDATTRISLVCDDFLHKMLRRRPEDRLTLEGAVKHPLFARVPWDNLANLRGPDLSKCTPRSTSANQGPSSIGGSSRRWVTRHETHVPDMAFVREFIGTLTNPNVIYATQPLGFTTRRNRNQRNQATKGGGSHTDTEKYHFVNHLPKTHNINVGGAVEIRNAQGAESETKKDLHKNNRITRRSGASAT